ncbi:MAG: sugar phosphate isomerase/epimerase [Verrucomicrobiaceae bacterium]|nr:MAG: sugar phosphate isomerase/epimerase [Verrucomicrobiaceae bacterium]
MTASSRRLAVCSWSLQPTGPQDLLAKLDATGIPRLQIALDPLLEAPGIWEEVLLRADGVEIVSGMFGCAGEDYTTLESIRLTGGVAPDATWEKNLAHIRAAAKLAVDLGLKLVTFHAGFLPHDDSDPAFGKMLGRLETVAGIFSDAEILLAMETGQETADSLALLLQSLPGVGVNFDPANMILYDKGDPIAAVRTLGPWIRQVHIKDAIRTKVPGTWGGEVAVGSGEVDWPGFFRALEELSFTGNYVIEREAGTQRIADILTARELVLNH